MPTEISLEEIRQESQELVEESKYLFEPTPDIFEYIQGDVQPIKQIQAGLEEIKEKDEFTVIVLYGKSKSKILIAEGIAMYLGYPFYDLLTEEDEGEEPEDLDIEVSNAFSSAFVQSLSEDIDTHQRVVVCWEDRKEDFYEKMSEWEQAQEQQFQQTILQKKSVIAIQLIDHPELIDTEFFKPYPTKYTYQIDDEYELEFDEFIQ